MASFEELLESWSGEQAVIHRDRESDGWIFICMHSTQLGPAAGGTRLKVYETPADGLHDAMRLSAGMSAKLAVADLGWEAARPSSPSRRFRRVTSVAPSCIATATWCSRSAGVHDQL